MQPTVVKRSSVLGPPVTALLVAVPHTAGAGAGLDQIIVRLEDSFTFNDEDGSVDEGCNRKPIDSRHTHGIAGRAGYEVTDNVLLYGRVSWARTRFSGLEPGGRTNLEGIRFGGGLEYAVTKNVAQRTGCSRTATKASDRATVASIQGKTS